MTINKLDQSKGYAAYEINGKPVEVFEITEWDMTEGSEPTDGLKVGDWYWCFTGTTKINGPFQTQEQALAAAYKEVTNESGV